MDAKDSKTTMHLNLVFTSQDGREVHFKVKKTTPFKRMMEAYYAKVGATEQDAFRFLLDGERIHKYQTPADVNMEDGDEIYVVLEQVGGSW
mmetsp:Transcript_7306/g.10274  ORF Transcript_7306/g.10274 Transcript_7306/m.10274 type:complete len:91 (+) Transcript_7306:77-349(+)